MAGVARRLCRGREGAARRVARAPGRAHVDARTARSAVARGGRGARADRIDARELAERRPGAIEQVDGEAQRLAAPAQVGIAPAPDLDEHLRHVGIAGLLARLTLDRAAKLPFVPAPFVARSVR